MAENANSALAVWNALKPKIRQLIQDEARSAVRRKKMTILSINTANQSVTVYEAANPNVTLTLQYRKESGVGSMSAGQSVMVEWIYDDLSTAVVSGPGQGWSANTVDGVASNPTLSTGLFVNAGAQTFYGVEQYKIGRFVFLHFGVTFATSSSTTKTYIAGANLPTAPAANTIMGRFTNTNGTISGYLGGHNANTWLAKSGSGRYNGADLSGASLYFSLTYLST